MHHKIMFSVFVCCFLGTTAFAQQDTVYTKKYAFAEKNKTEEYEKGQEFFLADGMYKVWNGITFNWGFYNEETKERFTEPVYDTITYRYLHSKKKGFYRVKQNDKWGMLGDDRTVWVPIKYDQLNYISRRIQHYISIELGGKYGVLAPDGKPVLAAEFDDILYDGYRYKVKKGEKWGLKDDKGAELIPTCFDVIEDHEYVEYTRVKIGKKWSIYNWIKDNPCGFAKAYDDIDYFSKYFVVRDNNRFGLLNIEGKEILPFEYEFMSPFFLKYLNSILVGKDKKVGVLRIDDEEKVHTEVPIMYNDVWVDEHNFKIKVRLKDKIDYFFNEQTLFELAYNDVQYYEDINRVMVKKSGKWGMVSIEGEIIIPIQYSKIHVMNPNQFMVEKNGRWGVVNGEGTELIPALYDEFDYRPKQNFFFVKKAGKWGIVSTKKGIILPPKYDDLTTLPNRMFLVKQKDLWGVVAPGGRVIVPMQYPFYKYTYKDRNVYFQNDKGQVVKKYPLL